MRETYAKVRALNAQLPGLVILATHDPDAREVSSLAQGVNS